MLPKRNLGFRGISLKKELIDDVERFVKEQPQMGYKNIADFCAEAVRLRLLELKRNYGLHETKGEIRNESIVFINRKNRRVAEVHLQKFSVEDVNQFTNHVFNLPELRKFLKEKGFTLETRQKL